MPDPTGPTTYTLDMPGDNGTPFRFVYWPADAAVRYYDRRYTRAKSDIGYGIDHKCEHGQACGPRLHPTDFTAFDADPIRGWQNMDVWDVDRRTVQMVGVWLTLLQDKGICA